MGLRPSPLLLFQHVCYHSSCVQSILHLLKQSSMFFFVVCSTSGLTDTVLSPRISHILTIFPHFLHTKYDFFHIFQHTIFRLFHGMCCHGMFFLIYFQLFVYLTYFTMTFFQHFKTLYFEFFQDIFYILYHEYLYICYKLYFFIFPWFMSLFNTRSIHALA